MTRDLLQEHGDLLTSMRRLRTALESHTYRYANEAQLHRALEEVLHANDSKHAWTHEHTVSVPAELAAPGSGTIWQGADLFALKDRMRAARAPKQVRFDFRRTDGLVIEVKIDGSFSEAVRQVDSYCALKEVSGVMIVATKPTIRMVNDFVYLRTKPIMVARLMGNAF